MRVNLEPFLTCGQCSGIRGLSSQNSYVIVSHRNFHCHYIKALFVCGNCKDNKNSKQQLYQQQNVSTRAATAFQPLGHSFLVLGQLIAMFSKAKQKVATGH